MFANNRQFTACVCDMLDKPYKMSDAQCKLWSYKPDVSDFFRQPRSKVQSVYVPHPMLQLILSQETSWLTRNRCLNKHVRYENVYF